MNQMYTDLLWNEKNKIIFLLFPIYDSGDAYYERLWLGFNGTNTENTRKNHFFFRIYFAFVSFAHFDHRF